MKGISLLSMLALTLALTSCDVHFGDVHYDVPWWVIAIPTVIILLTAFIVGGIIISKKKYVCPNCGYVFSPKFYKAAYSVHLNDDRVFKCPHCKKRGLCSPVRKNKK